MKWLNVLAYPIIGLSIYYFIWLTRMIDQGRSIAGVLACIMFGTMLIYSIKIYEWWRYRRYGMVALCVYITAWFGYLWLDILKAVNTSMVTGEPMRIAKENFVGIFGIEGFWGFGAFVPIYIAAIFIIAGVIWLWENYG
jgi:hypothetical protein